MHIFNIFYLYMLQLVNCVCQQVTVTLSHDCHMTRPCCLGVHIFNYMCLFIRISVIRTGPRGSDGNSRMLRFEAMLGHELNYLTCLLYVRISQSWYSWSCLPCPLHLHTVLSAVHLAVLDVRQNMLTSVPVVHSANSLKVRLGMYAMCILCLYNRSQSALTAVAVQ